MPERILIPMAELEKNGVVTERLVRPTYVEKLRAQGLELVYVHSFMTEEEIAEVYAQCSGVLFMGGSDIDPKMYMSPKEVETAVTEAKRCQLEAKILRQTLRDNKPFLGICHGAQMLGVVEEGKLVQHIPRTFPEEEPHTEEGITYQQLLDKPVMHTIMLKCGSKIADLLGVEELLVNSAHHQCVDPASLGETNLKVTGWSASGQVAEVLEDPHQLFCIGVQFHPEAMKGDLAKVTDKLFAGFAAAACEYTGRKVINQPVMIV